MEKKEPKRKFIYYNLRLELIIKLILIQLYSKKDEKKEESITKMAERNSNIWEAKYKMSEFQKDHYRFFFVFQITINNGS